MEAKVFNDPIHGQIKIHPLCIKIIDTPQFQRLRRIKQLGGVYHVYPGASHNRFEHSIGVCYLAGQLLKHLKSGQQEKRDIDDRDILCVEVAGLCHDLGHGPYSHLWDQSILRGLGNRHWKHEDGSVKMFDHLVKENELTQDFKKHLGITEDTELETELTFIKELISGKKGNNGSWEMKGRSEEKAFLYNVIANKENGIDVDKWDYFARDCYYLGFPNSFSHQRLMSFARVLNTAEEAQIVYKQICYRDKEAPNVYGMFYTRNQLHQRAYKHKTVKAIESMLTDALISSNTLLKFRGKNGQVKHLVDTVDDMEAYEQVDDEVIGHIMKMSAEDLKSAEDKENLRRAQEILKRIEKRQIYRCQLSPPLVKDFDIERATEEIVQISVSSNPESAMTANDFSLEKVSYDYGMKSENPVDKVYFYTKSELIKPRNILKNEVSMMLPATFSETRILLLYKKFTAEEEAYKELVHKAKKCFEEFYKPLCQPESN